MKTKAEPVRLKAAPGSPAWFEEARGALGLTQHEMARALGFGRQASVSDLERGERAASLPVQLLVQAYLDGYRPRGWPA